MCDENGCTPSGPKIHSSPLRSVASPITSSNVSTLGVAWCVPVESTGEAQTAGVANGYATTPVVVNGVVYTQDLASNVMAIRLTTGKVLWTTPATDACAGRPFCDSGISAAVTAIPGVVFAGHMDGRFRAYDGATGSWFGRKACRIISHTRRRSTALRTQWKDRRVFRSPEK